jgi:nucleoside-diphosphate-sugar epimerase
VVRGDLEDLTLLRAQAADSDGVVHMAFRHDIAFTGDFAGAAASDLAAIEALGDALAGTGNPLVIASGTLGLKPGGVGTERDLPDPSANPRIANAFATLELAKRDVRSVVIRFAPTVHGEGDHGFIATLVGIARDSGVSGYLEDGANRWPAVHRSDAADLVHRAVESAPAGSVLHATAEDGVTTKAIAEAIGAQLGVPVESIPAERAGHFSFLAGFFGMDAPASSDITRELLGWNPTGPTLIEDIEAGRYTS